MTKEQITESYSSKNQLTTMLTKLMGEQVPNIKIANVWSWSHLINANDSIGKNAYTLKYEYGHISVITKPTEVLQIINTRLKQLARIIDIKHEFIVSVDTTYNMQTFRINIVDNEFLTTYWSSPIDGNLSFVIDEALTWLTTRSAKQPLKSLEIYSFLTKLMGLEKNNRNREPWTWQIKDGCNVEINLPSDLNSSSIIVKTVKNYSEILQLINDHLHIITPKSDWKLKISQYPKSFDWTLWVCGGTELNYSEHAFHLSGNLNTRIIEAFELISNINNEFKRLELETMLTSIIGPRYNVPPDVVNLPCWSWRYDMDGDIELFLDKWPSSFPTTCKSVLQIINTRLQDLVPHGWKGLNVNKQLNGKYVLTVCNFNAIVKEIPVNGNFGTCINDALKLIVEQTPNIQALGKMLRQLMGQPVEHSQLLKWNWTHTAYGIGISPQFCMDDNVLYCPSNEVEALKIINTRLKELLNSKEWRIEVIYDENQSQYTLEWSSLLNSDWRYVNGNLAIVIVEAINCIKQQEKLKAEFNSKESVEQKLYEENLKIPKHKQQSLPWRLYRIVCPYCGHIHTEKESWKWDHGGTDLAGEGIATCSLCKKEFICQRENSKIYYNTWKIKNG